VHVMRYFIRVVVDYLTKQRLRSVTYALITVKVAVAPVLCLSRVFIILRMT